MKTAIAITVSSILSVAVTLCVCYYKYQALRVILEGTYIKEKIHLEGLTLQEAASRVVKNVEREKKVQLRCVFVPESLGQEMPRTITSLEGTAFFATITLEYSYACQIRFVGEDMLLFIR